AKGFQEGADVGLFAAITADEKERWGIGRTKNLAQERGAVQISPLQVVDEEDERVLVGEASEQLSEGRESASTQFFGVGNGRGFATSFSDDLDLTQDGKESSKKQDINGQNSFGLKRRDLREIPTQSIYDAVESLVGDGLLFVATTRQDDCVGFGFNKLIEEVAHEHSFAHAGAALNIDGDGLAGSGFVEGIVQCRHMSVSPN